MKKDYSYSNESYVYNENKWKCDDSSKPCIRKMVK